MKNKKNKNTKNKKNKTNRKNKNKNKRMIIIRRKRTQDFYSLQIVWSLKYLNPSDGEL